MMFAFFLHVRWWHEESMQFIYHLQSTKLKLSSKYIITAATNNKSPNWILVWYHFSSPPERKNNLFPRAKHRDTYISQNSSGRRKGKDGDGNTEKERHRERAEEERKRPHSSSSEGDDDAAPEEKEGSIPLPSNGPPAHGLVAGGGAASSIQSSSSSRTPPARPPGPF